MSPAPANSSFVAQSRRSGRAARLAVGLGVAGLLSGCAATDREASREVPAGSAASVVDSADPGRLGVVTVSEGVRIVHDDWADLGYRWEWSSKPISAGRSQISMIDVLGDVIAVQSPESWTSLIQTSTGAKVWQVRNTSSLTSFVDTFRTGDVLVSCGRPELFLMEIASGNLIARQPVDVVVTTAPVVYGGLAVFGTPTGQVLCHRFGTQAGDPLPPPFDDGSKEWGYLLDGAITAAPVRLGQTAGVVTQTGEVFFVDIPSGSGVGRARISGGMATDPVTDGRLMYVASLDQSIYAFAPTGGTWVWRYRTAAPLRSQPTYHDETLYVAVPGEGLIAFDVSESSQIAGRLGEVLWRSPEVSGTVVAVRSGELLVWDGSEATLVDRERGDLIASASLPRFRTLVSEPFEDGNLYGTTDNGLVIKFGPR